MTNIDADQGLLTVNLGALQHERLALAAEQHGLTTEVLVARLIAQQLDRELDRDQQLRIEAARNLLTRTQTDGTAPTTETQELIEQLQLAASPPAPDPVVIYDVMREAATRLTARYAQQVTVGGHHDPAIIAIQLLNAEVHAVDTRDIDAQRALTFSLHRRYEALRVDPPRVI